MICHLCETGASAQCSKCSRYICRGHTCSGRVCSECKDIDDAGLRSVADKIESNKVKRRCTFCGANDVCRCGAWAYHTSYSFTDLDKDDEWQNRRCATCGKYFCRRCGSVDSLAEGGRVYVWKRCKNHQRKKSGRISPPLLWLVGGYDKEDPEYWEPADETHAEY
jgi:hypothetical protein